MQIRVGQKFRDVASDKTGGLNAKCLCEARDCDNKQGYPGDGKKIDLGLDNAKPSILECCNIRDKYGERNYAPPMSWEIGKPCNYSTRSGCTFYGVLPSLASCYLCRYEHRGLRLCKHQKKCKV
ncbi:MAG: hypothetical protein JWQ07_79 [Ramlibacter sp.]|nr:hypothetical protein [Ramlibacter sp.]